MCGLVVILWITVGYSLSFSGNHQISHQVPNELLFGGNLHLLLVQIFVTLLIIIFISVMDIILIKLLSIVLPVSIDNEKLAAIQSK